MDKSNNKTESHGILKHDKKMDSKHKNFHWNEENLKENEIIKKELV